MLETKLLNLFNRGVDAGLPDAEFNRLALAVFAYQCERNRPYAAYCRARGRTSTTVAHWNEIPALPTAAFKEVDLTTGPPEEVRVVYVTSGTTAGAEKPGRHLLPDTRLYKASLLPNFRAHLLPDVPEMRILVCGPTAQHFQHSSLGHMHTTVLERFGAAGSGSFWREDGPRFPELVGALITAEAEGRPVCLLGTAFGFVHFLDYLESEGRTFRLPPGSRLMDTGGYKGRSREVPKADLYALYGARLGIPLTHIVNEYGMTELSSQFYDSLLRDVVLAEQHGRGSETPRGGDAGTRQHHLPQDISVYPCIRVSASGVTSEASGSGVPHRRRKRPPPWVRTQVVDPETLVPVPEGEVGLLRHFDLANMHTVVAIQTDDLGVWMEDGFEILGRAAGAEPRGCSLAVEELRVES